VEVATRWIVYNPTPYDTERAVQLSAQAPVVLSLTKQCIYNNTFLLKEGAHFLSTRTFNDEFSGT